MQSEKKSTFFGGAAVLMVGSILVKLIGAAFRIPLGNLLSNEAYVDFNTAYNVYNLFLTIATAGLPVALSKTIAESHALGRRNQVDRVFSVALKTCFVLGLLSFIAMSVFGGPLSVLMGDDSAIYCVRALSPSVLCVCVMSAFRGYYQGHSNMVPTAISQIIESFCKLCFGLALVFAVLAWFPGAESYRQRMAAVGAILGVSIGSVIALVYLILRFRRTRKEERSTPAADVADGDLAIFKRLLSLAVPITLGSAASSIVTLVDTRVVLNLLEEMYESMPELISAEAVEQSLHPGSVSPALYMAQGLKGVYDKLLAVYNLPSQLMIAFTVGVIPAVSACLARRDTANAGKIAESALRVSMILALPMGVGLFVLAGPVVELLFPGKLDPTLAPVIMAVLGLASIFVCIMMICNSILQAYGHVILPVLSVVVGGIVKVAVNYLLVGDPDINIKGAPVGTLACFAVVALLDVLIIRRMVPEPPSFLRAACKPLLASVLMGAAAWGVGGLVSRVAGMRLACLAGIGVGVLVYAVLVVVLKVFSKDDLALMPKGDKIAKFLHIS